MNAGLKFAVGIITLVMLSAPGLAQTAQRPAQTEKSAAEAEASLQSATQLAQSGKFKEAEPLAEHPVDLDLGIDQVSVVVGETTTLASATFIAKIPADEAAILRLFGC